MLKSLSESSQNTLNNIEKLKSPLKQKPKKLVSVFQTPKVAHDKTSDSTLQLDLTQIDKPVTSTPITNTYIDDSTRTEGNFSFNSLVESQDLVDKSNETIQMAEKRLLEGKLDVSDETLIRSLVDGLVSLRNNLNYYKIESKVLSQNNQDQYIRSELEHKLIKKELDKLRLEKSNDEKYDKLKQIAKTSLDNFEVVCDKTRILSKKALKYKIKYSKAKELLGKKQLEIQSLRNSTKFAEPGDSTVSMDHSVVSQSPQSQGNFDTLNMLASQALLVSERGSKSRKTNNENSQITKYPFETFNRKIPESNSRSTQKLPGINHLLNSVESPEYKIKSELNSNDTIDEEMSY